jgi:hypothetical protein
MDNEYQIDMNLIAFILAYAHSLLSGGNSQ